MGVGTVIVILVLAWLLMSIGYWTVFLALGFRFQVAEEGLWRSPGTPEGLTVLQAQGRRSVPTSEGLPRNRTALVDHLQAEATPSLVFRPDGRELYRNPAAADLLSTERRSPLLQKARRLAGHLGALRRKSKTSDAWPPLVEKPEIRIGPERFVLSATFLPPGLMDREWTTVVRAEPKARSVS